MGLLISGFLNQGINYFGVCLLRFTNFGVGFGIRGVRKFKTCFQDFPYDAGRKIYPNPKGNNSMLMWDEPYNTLSHKVQSFNGVIIAKLFETGPFLLRFRQARPF